MMSFLIGLILTPANEISVSNPPLAAIARAEVENPPRVVPTLKETVLAMAEKEGVDTTLVDNIVSCESKWDANAFNSETGDYGLWQINKEYWPDVDAKNPLRATEWALERIKQGYAHQWVCANCYLYIKAYFYKNLPLMADIQPNSFAFEGAVVIFQYGEVKHLAYLAELREDGFLVKEANYEPGMIGERLVRYDDPALVGFYDPALQTDKN